MKKWIAFTVLAALAGFALAAESSKGTVKPAAKKASVATALSGNIKLCSGINPNNFRDTIPMVDSADETDCQAWPSMIGGTTYALGCSFADGSISLGPSGGGPPDPNCGW